MASGKSSKAKGASGERVVKRYLDSRGWLIADRETTGLAGDDLFARDPSGKWWSVEVKHVKSLTNAHMAQAIRQSKERSESLASMPPNSMARALGITHDPSAWLLVWKPSGYRSGKQLLTLVNDGRTAHWEVWSIE